MSAAALQECPATLTTSALKREVYAADPHFARASADMAARLGPAWPARARALTTVLLRPEAVAGRRIARALDHLERGGFVARAAARVAPHPRTMHVLKRYRLNAATPDLLDVLELHNAAGPSLLVLLEDTAANTNGADASARLNALKGPAKPHLREPGQLRYELGELNEILTWAHVPDEAADAVRELGVLCGAAERRALLDGHRPPAALARRLYAECPPADLDVDAALARLREALRAPAAREQAGHREAAAILDGLARGERDWQLRRRAGLECRWRAPLDLLDAAGVPVAPWDRLLVATQFVAHTVPGVRPLL